MSENSRFLNPGVMRYLRWIILAALLYMPLFGHLDSLTIRVWDESRLAVNASEMARNNDFIVTYYHGHPDMWNTKPPLLIWIQAGFIKIFGFNELAIRLPSAFAALFTCAFIMLFAMRYLREFWFGFIAVMVLITASGYIELHAVRTGDYDALLTLFTTAMCLSFYAYTEVYKTKYLYLFYAFLSLAVLTKSVTSLMFLPGLFLYTLFTRKMGSVLKNRHVYIGFFLAFLLIAGYYFLREAHNPGYWAAVRQNELGGRYLETLENHAHGFWYYFTNFRESKFSVWLPVLPFAVGVGFLSKNGKIRRLTLFCLLLVLTFWLIISAAQTKLSWYDVPLYPFLAILVAIGLHYLFSIILTGKLLQFKSSNTVILLLFLFLCFFYPYSEILSKTYVPREKNSQFNEHLMSYHLRGALKGERSIQHHKILYDGYKAHVRFYQEILADRGANVFFADWTKLTEGDTVMVYQPHLIKYLKAHYELAKIGQDGQVVTYTIQSVKEILPNNENKVQQ